MRRVRFDEEAAEQAYSVYVYGRRTEDLDVNEALRHIDSRKFLWPFLRDFGISSRKDELHRLHRNEGKGLKKRDYDNVSDELIDERLEELDCGEI